MASRIGIALALFAGFAIPSAAMAELQKAKDDLAVTQPGHSVWINVLSNDSALGPNLRLLKAFKPAHGTATIENGGVRYTPAAGFQGSDTFRYMAQPAKSQPGEATVNVEVGSGGVVLRLQGRVVDDPIPFATVKASVGGFDFQATADAQGNYTLDIAALRGDAFVTLVAAGNAPSGAAVRFYSAVGEIARLAQNAGGDGVLVRDENNQVQITNLSTAQYSLLAEANGGAPVGNDQQLIPLVQSIDLSRLLELAAVIKLVTDGEPLPAGVDDVLELISDPAAVTNFEAALDPGQLATAQAQVEADTEVAPNYHAGAMPPNGYVLIPPSQPGSIQPFLGVARLLEFPGLGNGGGSLVSGSGGDNDNIFESDAVMSWQLAGGDVLFTHDVPYTLDGLMLADNPNPVCANMGWYYEETLVSTRLHRLQAGFGVDYVEVTDSVHRHFTDADDPVNCPAPTQDADVDSSYLRLAFKLFRGELPFAENEALGQIALTYFLPSEQRWGTALFDFNAGPPGNGGVPSAGLSFTWSIDTGHLLVHMSDGIEYEYWRFQSDGRKGEGLLAIVVLPDSRPAVSYNLAARLDPSPPDFALVSIPGTWHSGYSIAQFPGDGQELADFYLVLNNDAGHTGYQHFVDAAGVDDHVGIHWGNDFSRFVALGYADQHFPVGFRQVPACSGNPEPCWLSRRREWIPLAQDGNRYYVIETVSFPNAPFGPLVVNDGAQRVNFWEKLPP
jgi:hypothetical protein